MQQAHEAAAFAPRRSLPALLTSPAFLVAVGLLLVNDWLLKPAFRNWFTGKLSDVAGVFAVPLLWAALFPTRRKAGFVLTAIAFALWKTPLLDAPLATWNHLGYWRITRVVDLTDWIALLALVPSYRIAERYATSLGRPLSSGRRLAALVAGLAATVALAADSVAPPRYPIPDTAAYAFQASREDVRKGLNGVGFEVTSVTVRPERRRAADTLALYIRQPPERAVSITVELREVSPAEVSLRLLSASAFGPAPSTASIERAFEKQVVEPLRDWVTKHHGTENQ